MLTGAFAAAAHGVVSAGWVLLIVAVIVSVVAVIAEPGAALFVTLAGWFTTAGFSRPPYAQLQVSWASGSRSALVLGCCGLAGIAVGLGVRRLASGFTLWIVDASDRDMLIEAQAQAEAWMESADPNGWTVPLPGDEQPTPTAAPEPAKALAPTDAATPAEATVPADAAPPAEAAVPTAASAAPTAASAAPVQAAALADELPVPAQSAGPATATPWRRRLGASMLGGSSGIDRRREVSRRAAGTAASAGNGRTATRLPRTHRSACPTTSSSSWSASSGSPSSADSGQKPCSLPSPPVCC